MTLLSTVEASGVRFIQYLHGVPKKIVSDRGTQSSSRFSEKLHEAMDTKLNFSSAYHP
jgi:hypothetical protein